MRAITIVGGGLAGLTLGILLRKSGAPVQVVEAGSYPRHRVCGEFLSGAGGTLIRQLIGDAIQPKESTSLIFSNQRRRSRALQLPEAAFTLSRYELDHALACRFVDLGGELLLKTRWTEGFFADGVVRATGRRAARPEAAPFTGLKAHLSDLTIAADLELHFADGGYVGLARLPDGRVNACGLFQNVKLHDVRANLREILASVMHADTAANVRKARICEDSICAVASMSLEADLDEDGRECRLGDTISMISPFTGNGMSLAIESARLAAPLLEKYCWDGAAWNETRAAISQNCKKQFSRRFLTSSKLRKALSFDVVRSCALSSIETFEGLLPLLFRLTR